MIPLTWKHVEAHADADFVVAPDERLDWPRTVGIGAQHVVAMFGATFLVPVLTGFPPATTLLFSGVGTVLFLIITGNRLPSYLGSSFSVIAPVTAAVASNGTGSALGGLVAVGAALVVIGLVVHVVGTHWIDVTLPPVVTGAIVALIGFNLAPAAKANFEKGPLVGLVTLVLLVATLAFFRGIIGRLAIFLAVVAGYVLALFLGDVDTSKIAAAPWVGLPEFHDADLHPCRTADVLARGHRAGRREHRAREVRRADDRNGRRPADGPRAGRRRRGHHPGRIRRRVGDHHLRGEHRCHGGHPDLFDGGVLGRRRGGHRAVVVPEGRCGDLGHSARACSAARRWCSTVWSACSGCGSG